jgi:hypothetical protein
VALDEEENRVAVEETPVVEVTELNTVPTVGTPHVPDGPVELSAFAGLRRPSAPGASST